MYFLNEPVFCEKINEKNCLIYVISSSDFKTSSMVLIFFALAFLIIVINLRTIDKGVTSGGGWRGVYKFCILLYYAREKKTTFDGKVVETLARNTNTYKTCKLRATRFSAFYNSSRPNFAILPIKI